MRRTASPATSYFVAMSGFQFDNARSALARGYGIHLQPLPGSAAVNVTQQQAVGVALRQFGVPDGISVEAKLVIATGDAYATVGAMWLALLPDRQVAIRGSKGPPFSYTATLAVLIDADSGEFIKAAALAS